MKHHTSKARSKVTQGKFYAVSDGLYLFNTPTNIWIGELISFDNNPAKPVKSKLFH
jgi:hypothetical protein